MTAYRNMAFNLQLRGLPKEDIDARVRDAAATLRIEHLLERRPRQLSGGEQQRVALGRALVRNPAVFLFDEPLSNLDAKLRVEMRREIARLHRQLGATMVYVTHDQAEAMTLGSRIVVMHGGRVQQVGKPLDVYRHPKNTFVAGFIGSPPMNLIPGRLTPDGKHFVSDGGVFSFPPPPEWRAPLAGSGGRALVLGVRPEHVSLADAAGGPAIPVRVDLVEPLGQEVLVYATAVGAAAACEITARLATGAVPVTGETATIHLDPAGMVFFDSATKERIG
jgi:ABC-type sugar transport system ATPase subunit